jgi:hypothetical protein
VPVRHKILDVMATPRWCYPITGHLLHTAAATRCTLRLPVDFEESDAWRVVEGQFDPIRLGAPVQIPVKSAPRLAN